MTAPSTTDGRGRTRIDERVTRTIISEALDTVPGTVKLERLGRRSFPRIDAIVDTEYRTVSVEAFIACSFPAPVTSVAEMARRAIAGAVKTYLDYDCESVSVVVGTVVRGEQPLTLEQLRQYDPVPTPVEIVNRRPAELDAITTSDFYPGVKGREVSVDKRSTALTDIKVAERAPLLPIDVTPSATPRQVTKPQRREALKVTAPKGVTAVPVRAPKRAAPHSPRVTPRRETTPVRVNSVSVRSAQRPQPIQPIRPSAPKRTRTTAVQARKLPVVEVRKPKPIEPYRPSAPKRPRLIEPRRNPQKPTIRPVVNRSAVYQPSTKRRSAR
ncbi:hypothetical protein CCICO_01375 [Corynebacterium ciconiae DSM 44920]|uniref:hypothetical protein n=1 Tax=Corynebacterium ciconiae TaxID=227319 RepID=UPI0003723A16|nr:hypothetical protein [Corynebacterium ciconiae]WKD60329.1 hypothetical protein CCICO_01375 [Corynebacterium ciconiae DSM 44920]